MTGVMQVKCSYSGELKVVLTTVPTASKLLIKFNKCTHTAVHSQVILQGPVGREIWLAVDLRVGKWGEKVTGWMQSSELQRRAACDADWLARLRDKAREGWSVEGHNWKCSGRSAATGHGLWRAVVE